MQLVKLLTFCEVLSDILLVEAFEDWACEMA